MVRECVLRHFIISFHVATGTPLGWSIELEDEDKLSQAVQGVAGLERVFTKKCGVGHTA